MAPSAVPVRRLWPGDANSRALAIFKRASLALAIALTGVWGFHLLDAYASGWQPWIRWTALIGSLAGAAVFLAVGPAEIPVCADDPQEGGDRRPAGGLTDRSDAHCRVDRGHRDHRALGLHPDVGALWGFGRRAWAGWVAAPEAEWAAAWQLMAREEAPQVVWAGREAPGPVRRARSPRVAPASALRLPEARRDPRNPSPALATLPRAEAEQRSTPLW
ncbi:MAG: hypothetical protein LKI24_14465 [Acidipropionibacterium sp.]|nr:hypothetical protein [Acidipropionibacterium sp.]